MANYQFISNAKFRPFSYQEMIQPLQAYTNEYNVIEEGIGELGAQADMFSQLANEQTDPKAYAMYKQYSDDLTRQAESLAKQGLTPASRQGLIDMKRRYSSDIVPIQTAFNRRQQLVDEQRKALQQDSTLLFDRPASTLSLDELMENPALSPQSYSGAIIAKQVGTAAQNLARDMKSNPRKWNSILQGQYFETMMQKGYTPEQVLLAAANDPKAPKELRNIVEDAVGSSGIASWGDETALNRAYEYARQGLWSAIGDTQYQQLQDRSYIPQPAQASGSGTPQSEGYQDLFPTVTAGRRNQDAYEQKLKGLKGLKVTESGGLTTEDIENLQKMQQEALQKLEDYKKNYKDIPNLTKQPSSSYGALGQAMRDNQSGKSKYNALKEQYDKIQRELSSKTKDLSDMITKYGYLSDNPTEAVQLGLQLEKNQAIQQDNVRPFIFKNNEQVIRGIEQSLSSIGKESRDRQKLGLSRIKEDGSLEYINSKKTKELFDSSKHKLGIEGSSQDGLILTDEDGNRYSISGIQEITKFNNKLSTFDNYLSDYSQQAVSKAIPMNVQNLFNNEVSNKTLATNIINTGEDLGNGMYGVTVRDTGSGDIIKIVASTDGNVFTSSLQDELEQGKLRQRSIDEYLTTNARGLSRLFSGILKDPETSPNKQEYTYGDR